VIQAMPSAIYLDNNATTPVDPAVFEAMRPFFLDHFGNPSNQNHAAGSFAAKAVEHARRQVASSIGAEATSIIFTSGATESDNLAILGTCRALRTAPGHIVMSAIEHKAVIEPCRILERSGWSVSTVAPDAQGLIDGEAVKASIRADTVLVSIMAANNEVGTIQAIEQIGSICEAEGIVFHCDAAQSLGRMPIDVDSWKVDLLSLSAHKAYGPKGIGALFIREKRKSVALVPLSFGGGQESGIRPGTLAVPCIVGFGVACELATSNLQGETKRLCTLRKCLLTQLREIYPKLVVHGHPTSTLPGLLSVGFPGIDGDAFFFAIRDVAISQGAACDSGSPEPSHVLTALGVSYELARASFRFGIGRFNTIHDMELVAKEVARVLTAIH
jgi:cysteine desulfurase